MHGKIVQIVSVKASVSKQACSVSVTGKLEMHVQLEGTTHNCNSDVLATVARVRKSE
jgi:hypothetical protein